MRTQVTYLQGGYLNSGAAATVGGSTEPVTGLPIGTGVVLGDFIELTDAQALSFAKSAAAPLYSGIYQKVQLDSGATAPSVGQALYWVASNAANNYSVTNVQSGNAPDFAGVVIDSTMTVALPYAWIQVNGKCTVKYKATITKTGSTAVGDSVFLNLGNTGADLSVFDVLAAATAVVCGGLASGSPNLALCVGRALAITAGGANGLARITTAQARF